MEPRTGKSKAALDAVGMLALKGEVQRVLILCPKGSLDIWIGQLEQHFPLAYEWETRDDIWELPGYEPAVRFYLCNYELFRQRRKRGKTWLYPLIREIEAWRPDLIICDESHRLKRAGGVTAQSTWRTVARQRRKRRDGRPYVHLLSGTPNPKGWIDIFAQFRVMDDEILGTDKASFEERHVIHNPYMRHQIVGYRGIKRLEKVLAAHAFTCTAEEAGLAGKVFFEKIRVDLPPTARRAYDEMAEELITQLESGEVVRARNAGVKRLRLAQITGGFTTEGDEIHHAKLNATRDYLELVYDQEEKIVVYATHLPEVRALEKLAKQVGFSTFRIDGSVKNRDRTSALRAFQGQYPYGGPTHDCLVFQVQAASVSLELSAAAEVLYYSLPLGWENYYGSYQRVLGPNQKRPVRVTHIVARDTVDVSAVYGLIEKEDQHRTLMKDPRRYLYGLIQ